MVRRGEADLNSEVGLVVAWVAGIVVVGMGRRVVVEELPVELERWLTAEVAAAAGQVKPGVWLARLEGFDLVGLD